MEDDKQITQVYDEFVIKHRAAYAGFKSIYEDKNPPPVEIASQRDYVSMAILLFLAVVMVATVLVSGSRTILEFGGDWIGVSAFVMLEGGLIAYAFFRARRGGSTTKIEDSRKLALVGLGLAFISALAANIHRVLIQHGVVTDTNINTAINLLVAISAPSLAFISSDMMALELMAGDAKKRKAHEDYERLKADWLDGLNRAWAGQQSKWGVRVDMVSEQTRTPDGQTQTGRLPSGASVLSLSEQTDTRQTGHSGYGHNRTPDGQTQVIAYLSLHPEDAKLPSRELAKRIGVGHDTANKGRNVWRNQQVDSEVQL